jgi:hypothetical protein
VSRVRVTTSARCLEDCGWTPEGDPDLAARKHTGEGAYAKKPGPHHPTVVEAVAVKPCPSCGRRAAITAPPWVCDVCIAEDGGDE